MGDASLVVAGGVEVVEARIAWFEILAQPITCELIEQRVLIGYSMH